MIVGAVAIGRNEGERLLRCLQSMVDRVQTLVYVDSGSTDDSVAAAQRIGAEVVELDTSIPFTAARARNAGLQRLLEIEPGVTAVQFVDGDCEVVDGWIEQGRDYVAQHDDVAVVSGRRRERHPERSIYNRLCDMEWDTPIGEVRACHGDAMMCIGALQAVGGFRDDMIAGEEPELCVRIRRAGWRIMRLDADMTRHDADMTRFGQWWKRTVRGGHAYAEGAWLHGRSPERHNVRPVLSTLAYAGVLPLAIIAAPFTYGLTLLALLVYPALYWRVRMMRQKRGDTPRAAGQYARFCVLGKFAQAVGVMKFLFGRKLLRRSGRLIEYKQPTPGPAPQRSG